MYYSGGHLTQSYVRAAEWFARAAEQGHPLAQFTYATMCEIGRGVVQDRMAAFQWFAVSAARQIDPIYRERASRSRDRLAPRLTPQKKAEAEKRIAAWTPRIESALPAGRR